MIVLASTVTIGLLSWNVYTTHTLATQFAKYAQRVDNNALKLSILENRDILPAAERRITRLETIIELHGLDGLPSRQQ
jgi:hypothetical protein